MVGVTAQRSQAETHVVDVKVITTSRANNVDKSFIFVFVFFSKRRRKRTLF